MRVRYLLPAPAAPIEKEYLLDEDSRTNIWVNFETFPDGSGGTAQLLADTDVSAVIETVDPQKPIIVERAMYADTPTQGFGAGHEAAGVTAPATSWYLAEGVDRATSTSSSWWPTRTTSTANVQVTYLLTDGAARRPDAGTVQGQQPAQHLGELRSAGHVREGVLDDRHVGRPGDRRARDVVGRRQRRGTRPTTRRA